MNFEIRKPEDTFRDALLYKSVDETELKRFEKALNILIKNVETAKHSNETEEHLKNMLRDFLHEIFYSNYYVNTKSYVGNHQADLAIYSSNTQNSPVNVIFEIKRPNNTEMITQSDCNNKALHEAITYYLWEKVSCNNIEMKHIVVTDIYNWFIFDASDFHHIFYENNQLVNTFKQWKSKATDATGTADFYKHLKNFIDKDKSTLPVAFFNLPSQDNIFSDTDYFKSDIINFYKILSPEHLLKHSPRTFASYSLNRDFYYELLYIFD